MIDWNDMYAVPSGTDDTVKSPDLGVIEESDGIQRAWLESRDGSCTVRKWYTVVYDPYYPKWMAFDENRQRCRGVEEQIREPSTQTPVKTDVFAVNIPIVRAKKSRTPSGTRP